VDEQREEALFVGADSMQILAMMNSSGFFLATTSVTVNFYDCRTKRVAGPAGAHVEATQ